MGCNFSSQAEAVGVPQNKQQQQQKPQQQKPASPITAVVYGKISPIYESLPSGAEKYMIRNVYDGDTLTLVDERRVRLLGIDTPELKEKQPCAEEAEECTKKLCHKKEIYLTYDGKKRINMVGCWRLSGYLQMEDISASMKESWPKAWPLRIFPIKTPRPKFLTSSFPYKNKRGRPRREFGAALKTMMSWRRPTARRTTSEIVNTLPK
jgi:hypothetical protein